MGQNYSLNDSDSNFGILAQAIGKRQTRSTTTGYNIYRTSTHEGENGRVQSYSRSSWNKRLQER